MEREFNYLKSLIEEKKKANLTQLDSDKLKQAESLLSIEGIFFKVDINTAFGLLNFIGVPKNQIKELYSKLTSIEAYKTTMPKEYELTTEEEIIKNSK